jgi:hypothetical protein
MPVPTQKQDYPILWAERRLQFFHDLLLSLLSANLQPAAICSSSYPGDGDSNAPGPLFMMGSEFRALI